MLAARIAFSDPARKQARNALMEAHKAHLRSAKIHILRSGPFVPAQHGLSGALIIADVEDLAQLSAFSEADPFVQAGVYMQVHIVAWTVTIEHG